MNDVIIAGPRVSDKQAIRQEADELRRKVLSGEVTNPALLKALRKEMGQSVSDYDGEWTLADGEYLKDVYSKMDLSEGVNLINAAVGSGKTTFYIDTPSIIEREEGKVARAKHGYIVLVPLNSIRLSFEGDNDVFSTGICTWNQVDTILRHQNKEYFTEKTLVIDEVHGFFLDYGYKAAVINKLVAAFSLFKSVILMSGTATRDDFSGIEFRKAYKINKPSVASKVIHTIVGSKIQDLVLNHLNSSKRKTIVLLNDKSQCEALNNMCTRTGMVVNADKKNDQSTIDLYRSGLMDFDILYGTYSIVEGLSIENVEEEVDVVIVGDEHPARIEQFTNRFRKVSKLKSVTYFIAKKEVQEVSIFNRPEVLADARIMKEMLQLTYGNLSTDEAKYSFTSQYKRDITGSMVYFHDGTFEISHSSIDFAYSEHRQREYSNDFELLKTELEKYGFKVRPIHFAEGDAENNKVITDTTTKIKEEAQEARREVIREYLTDALTGDVKTVEDATELYNATHESAQKLLKRGLRKSDFTALIEGVIEDETFFYRAHMDADYYATGHTIRELIINRLGGKTKLDAFDIRDVADGIITKVLVEYFDGKKDLMMKHPLWKKSVSLEGNTLVSSSSKGAKSILERYITLSKGKQERINGNRISVCDVVHLSLTGLHFDTPAFIPPAKVNVPHVEALQTLDVLKLKFQRLGLGK